MNIHTKRFGCILLSLFILLSLLLCFLVCGSNDECQSVGCDSGSAHVWIDPVTGLTYDTNKVTVLKCPCGVHGKIKVREGVRIVGNRAFRGCTNLTEIVLPTSIEKIEKEAFLDCQHLETVLLSGMLRSIGESAFGNCKSLRKVRIDAKGKEVNISVTAFDGCEALSDIEAVCDGKTERVPIDRCRKRGKMMLFQEGELKKEVLTETGDGRCSVFVPRRVNGIDFSFRNYEITNVVIAAGNETYRREGELVVDERQHHVVKCLTTARGRVTIPNGITEIGPYAFNKCDGVTEIVLPPTVSNIASFAFSYSRLHSLALATGIQAIAWDAFRECRRFKKIVAAPGEGARIKGLLGKGRKWTLRGDELFLGEFSPNRGQSSDPETGVIWVYSVSNGVATVEDADLPKSFRGRLVVPNRMGEFPVCTIRELGIGHSVSGVTSVILPAGLKELGNWAFHRMSSLRSVELPASLQTIGGCAFCGCKALELVFVSETEKETDASGTEGVGCVGENAFENCGRLISVELPPNIASISDSTFSGCTNLTRISLPRHLRSMSTWTIAKTPFFNELPDGLLVVDSHLIGAKRSEQRPYHRVSWKVDGGLCDVAPPKGTKTILDGAFRRDSRVSSVIIPEGVKYIGRESFRGCTSLTNVTIPASVSFIGEGAFADCPELRTITAGCKMGVLTERSLPMNRSLVVKSSLATNFLTVKGVGVQAVTNKLMSVMGPAGSVRVLPDTNIFQVWDEPENIEKLKSVAQSLSKRTDAVVTNTYALAYPSPVEMKRILEGLTQIFGQAEIIADEKSNAVTIICEKSKLHSHDRGSDAFEHAVKSLDCEVNESTIEFERTLKRASVADAVETINAIFGAGIAKPSSATNNAVSVVTPKDLCSEIEMVLDSVDCKLGNLLFEVEILRVGNVKSVSEAQIAVRDNSAKARLVKKFNVGGPGSNGAGCTGSGQTQLHINSRDTLLSIDLCARWIGSVGKTNLYALVWGAVCNKESLSDNVVDARLRQPVILGGFMAAEDSGFFGFGRSDVPDTAYLLRVTLRDLDVEDLEQSEKRRVEMERAEKERRAKNASAANDESQEELRKLAEEVRRRKLAEANKGSQQKGGAK